MTCTAYYENDVKACRPAGQLWHDAARESADWQLTKARYVDEWPQNDNTHDYVSAGG